MGREWKPGDVAILSFNTGETAIGVRSGSYERWDHSGAFGGGSAYVDIGGFTVRPLVVIDPEDREQVEEFTHLFLAHHWSSDYQTHTDTGQAALREFADPKPPKPEEPTGLGAVVEDADGVRWVRTESKPNLTGTVWTSSFHVSLADRSVTRAYDDIAAVKVLSKGIS